MNWGSSISTRTRSLCQWSKRLMVSLPDAAGGHKGIEDLF